MGNENTSRIAKNTVIMYVRMFVLMLIGLYTSRVILNILGVEDYGVYNVVGGLVTMFSIISSSLSSSVSRYLTFEIGRGNSSRLSEIFSSSVIVLAVLAVVIVLLLEVAGLWFLENKLVIPEGRMGAAQFVMQCSIATFALNLLNTPFIASIIAYERFGIYAYLTLVDAVMKLVVVFALHISPFDKLKTYALLLLGVTVLVQCIYMAYCHKSFPECRLKRKYNPSLLREMGGFAGWSFFGNASWIINSQGIDILVNLFFGVTLNAARGIANQVNSIVQSFVNNFMTALNPQITKSYAQGDFHYMQRLVFAGAKYSFFLMLICSIPLCLETEQILVLWLKLVPNYAVPFVRLTLISTMIILLSNTLTTAQSSTGRLKKYSIVTSLYTFAEFPLTYICFRIGWSPISCYVTHIVVYSLLLFAKIGLVKGYIHITYWDYCREVLLRAALVTLVALALPLWLYFSMDTTIWRLLIICIVSVFSSALAVFYLGMLKDERKKVVAFINQRINFQKQ